jgi:hypothetical protein
MIFELISLDADKKYRVSQNSWVTNSGDYCSAHISSSWAVDTSMASSGLFTREYTQCTAGYTFCFVVVVVVVVVGVVVVVATFNQTWHYFS